MTDWRILSPALLWCCLCAGVLGQSNSPSPVPPKKPAPAFSPALPSGSAWTVTIRSPWEMSGKRLVPTAGARPDEQGAPAVAELVKIENTISVGVRREVLHYRDGSNLTRYVVRGFVLYMDPVSGEPLIESDDYPTTGSVHGVNRLEELAWIADRYYEGEAVFQGRPCHVFRQYAPDWRVLGKAPEEDTGRPARGLARGEIKNPVGAKVLATAYLDRETLRPVALETLYGTWIYSDFHSAPQFQVPAELQNLARALAEAAAEQATRYKVRP